MAFLNGRVTYTRFQVGGDSPLPFDEADLESARRNLIGQFTVPDAPDGVAIGWSGGEHVLDLTLDPAKNILDDALHLGLRVDTDKIPGELLRAYTKIEIDARAFASPTGFVTKAQREEAREAALARARAEAADGRFRRQKLYPVLWDGLTNFVYAGATSQAVLDRFVALFRATFDRMLEPVTAGRLALDQVVGRGEQAPVETLSPVWFVGEAAQHTVAWTDADATRPDHLGNEFLLWLWHTLQHDGDKVTLADGSDATVMLAKTLVLDCPRGLTGRDSLANEGPSSLPEAHRALQAGKLPRRAGLIIVRQGAEYELTLQAETLAVSGLALPRAEVVSGREARIARVESLRHLVETLDLLYDAFGRRRTGPGWTGELGRIRRWLQAA
jgi:hypothetical protein